MACLKKAEYFLKVHVFSFCLEYREQEEGAWYENQPRGQSGTQLPAQQPSALTQHPTRPATPWPPCPLSSAWLSSQVPGRKRLRGVPGARQRGRWHLWILWLSVPERSRHPPPTYPARLALAGTLLSCHAGSVCPGTDRPSPWAPLRTLGAPPLLPPTFVISTVF